MRALLLTGLMFAAPAALGQDKKEDNLNITGNNRTAIIATERQQKGMYDGAYNFAPAIRAGDFIFVSGAVAGAFGEDTPVGKVEFQTSIRRAFNQLDDILKAGNASLNDVVKIRTFHVFDSPHTTLTKHEQIGAVAEVKNEFINEPHPAWTAVGSTALYPDKGLVEIEVVVYAPQKIVAQDMNQ